MFLDQREPELEVMEAFFFEGKIQDWRWAWTESQREI